MLLVRKPFRHARSTPRPSCLHAPYPGRAQLGRVARKSVAVETLQQVSVAEIVKLTDRIVELEDELQAMFESGRPMPKASVVTRVRDNITNLKLELSEMLEQVPQDAGREGAASTLDKARKLLRGLSSTRSGPLPPEAFLPPSEYALALAVLEAENEALREEAQVLLTRQQLLEELVDKLGIKLGK